MRWGQQNFLLILLANKTNVVLFHTLYYYNNIDSVQYFFVFVIRIQPINGGDASDVHLAIEEIERRFQEVMHRHSPMKHLHIHVIASRVRLEMKGAFADVKDQIKVM